MYISVCRSCNHFLVTRRPPGTVPACQECGGALRAATIAERDTLGQGMSAKAPSRVTIEAAADVLGENIDVARPATGASAEEGPVAACSPVRPKTSDEVWLAGAFELLPAAMARISREERQVVIGYYFDQQSVAELAETYGLDGRRVAALIQSALAQLRSMLR